MAKFIFPYQMYSKSVHALREGVKGIKIIRTEGSTYVHRKSNLIINWGSSAPALMDLAKDGPVVNQPSAVALCSNKRNFFEQVAGRARTPEWTKEAAVAQDWANNGILVVARTTLTGHSGEGIVFSDEDEAFAAKGRIFTKYVKKLEEFRVHIFNGEVIDVQQKKLRTQDENGEPVDKEAINWRVRSHKNGFIYARNDVRVPDDVIAQSFNAYNVLQPLGLDFGAFDIIYNAKENNAYVLECNTAPGLTGTTATNYINKINNLA